MRIYLFEIFVFYMRYSQLIHIYMHFEFLIKNPRKYHSSHIQQQVWTGAEDLLRCCRPCHLGCIDLCDDCIVANHTSKCTQRTNITGFDGGTEIGTGHGRWIGTATQWKLLVLRLLQYLSMRWTSVHLCVSVSRLLWYSTFECTVIVVCFEPRILRTVESFSWKSILYGRSNTSMPASAQHRYTQFETHRSGNRIESIG